ncbi:protein of unknown function [Acidithiobacillus ferrivorans]|uniref:Uncharacterized protein n=1 Tax=Acidithiobacillus ferrivorans TaxID=160808 RepID=A0ABY1MSI2_9PROT|nr:protein of unknown function [Acidithiobacillus ferrivorans]
MNGRNAAADQQTSTAAGQRLQSFKNFKEHGGADSGRRRNRGTSPNAFVDPRQFGMGIDGFRCSAEMAR